jgi:hypothetical protein
MLGATINTVPLHYITLFTRYINLTIDGAIYPSQYFTIGAAFVCQAGNFWTLLRILFDVAYQWRTCLSGTVRPVEMRMTEDWTFSPA